MSQLVSSSTFAFFAAVAMCSAADVAGDKPEDRARAILSLFLNGKHEEFIAAGTDEVQRQFPASKSREVGEALRKQYGPFMKELDATPRETGGMQTVLFRLRFEKSILKLQMALDADDRMASFLIVGVESIEGWKPPKYAKKDRFDEHKTEVVNGSFELPAILTMPKGVEKVPALVLVHGSGPHDEDESIGPNKPFRDLAEGLSSKGIAVLRYEKRTHKYGTQMKAEEVTLDDETIDDAVAAAELLRHEPRVDPHHIFVLGHSLGGMAAPFIASHDKRLAGIIIMAGSARPLVDIVEEQIAYIANVDGVVSEEEKKQIAEVHQAAEAISAGRLDEVKKPLLGAPTKYWARINAMDPVAEAKKLGCPILILQGGRDYQVTAKCYDRWRAGLADHPHVAFHLYEPMNHLMISGKGPASPADYDKTGHVSKQVVQDIADWIRSTARTRSQPE